MRNKLKILVALGLVAIGSITYAGTENIAYTSSKFSTYRSAVAVADSTAYDGPNVINVVPFIYNPNLKPNVRVGLKFSVASATCVAHIIRGDSPDGVVFFPKDQSTATFTAPSAGTIGSLYVSPSSVFDTAGCNAVMILVEAPSSGAVNIDAGIY